MGPTWGPAGADRIQGGGEGGGGSHVGPMNFAIWDVFDILQK